MTTALAPPSQFQSWAIAYPDAVKRHIAQVSTPEEARDGLAKAQAVADYAKHIKAAAPAVNHVQYGKLLYAAKVGELCPAGEPGRGKKKPPGPSEVFHKDTLTAYRKLDKHQRAAAKIDRYFKAVCKAQHEDEVSIAGFLRFVADGNLKANQNKGVVEWYTPALYVEAARQVMGSIDLDPASSDEANEVVKANAYYTQEDSGLEYAWAGNVFMNPPFKASLIKPFVAKLCEHIQSGEVPQAVLLTNNNTDTAWWHQAAALATAVCFTVGRVPFYSPDGKKAQPTNGHTFCYFGERLGVFDEVFGRIGMVMVGANCVG